jgi:hypothetical protein
MPVTRQAASFRPGALPRNPGSVREEGTEVLPPATRTPRVSPDALLRFACLHRARALWGCCQGYLARRRCGGDWRWSGRCRDGGELGPAGVDVALVERTGSFAAKVGEALPPRARVVLTDLGVWKRFAGGDHLRCYGNRSAWGTSRLRDYDFILDPHGCGWQVDRADFDAMLLGAAVEAGTRLLRGAKVVGWERSPSGWELTVRGEGRIGGVRPLRRRRQWTRGGLRSWSGDESGAPRSAGRSRGSA